MPGIDNYAHAGGFLGGYATSAFFNPLTRERGDHMLVAGALPGSRRFSRSSRRSQGPLAAGLTGL